jgi:hypothetical protein
MGSQLRVPPKAGLRGPKYVQCMVYLGQHLGRNLKRRAESESWQLADLARGMIIAGLTFRFIYDSEKHRSLEHFVAMTGALNSLDQRVAS